MGSCILCKESQNLNEIATESKAQSVAFLKRCPISKVSSNDLLCSFCTENVKVVLGVRDVYSFSLDSDEQPHWNNAAIHEEKNHRCILCEAVYVSCSEVQSHLIKHHSDAEENAPLDVHDDDYLSDFETDQSKLSDVLDINQESESTVIKREDVEMKPDIKTLDDFAAQTNPELSLKNCSVVITSLTRDEVTSLLNPPVTTDTASLNGNELDHQQENEEDKLMSEISDESSEIIPVKKRKRNRKRQTRKGIQTSESEMQNEIKCSFCDSLMKTSEFKEHMEKMHSDVPAKYPCRNCCEVFFSIPDLAWHMLKSHQPQKSYNCHFCKAHFLKRSSFQKHLRKLHDKNYEIVSDFICFYCCESLLSLEEYKKHLEEDYHMEPENLLEPRKTHNAVDFKCQHCQKTYPTFQRMIKCLNRPIKRQFEKKPPSCPHCKLIPKNIDRHMVVSHPDILYGNVCPKCNTEVEDIKSHLRKFHSTVAEKHFECDLCGSKHLDAKLLQVHKRRRHSGTLNKICEICGKDFFSKGELKRHMESHSDERKFQCKKCGRTFKSDSGLNGHYKFFHSDIKNYSCSTCRAKFLSSSDLNNHLKVVHNNIKKFQCQECSWSFNHKGQFNAHVAQVHRGIKKYKCDICGQQFGHGSSLTKHKRVHLKKGEHTNSTSSKSS